MSNPLTAQAVANFLQEHPEFFAQNAELFSMLEVPHPHQSHAISLGERQILILRERQRELEFRLADLVHNASFNDSTAKRLNDWCARMLAEQSSIRLPGEVALGLAEQFNLQEVGLRVWGLDIPAEGVGAPVDESVHTYANELTTPYCGNNTELAPTAWLSAKPASLAIIPLRTAQDQPAFGLLVLGSDDAERFSPEMGTAFLETVGRLASAALSRLKPADTSGQA